MEADQNNQVLMKWQVPEFVKHDRGRYWYLLAILALVAILLYAIFTSNFFLIVIMVLTVIIMFIYQRQEPEMIDFAITTTGLMIGQKFYPYEELSRFWIITEKTKFPALYIDFKSVLRPHLDIPLEHQNPLEIRDILLKHVLEDLEREEEPILDFLSRWLKI